MTKNCGLFYFFVLTIPIFLGVLAWQSFRYTELESSVRRLEADQKELVVENRKLIASAAVLSAPSRIEQIAVQDLGLSKILPENVLQVRIDRGYRR
jgi:cell division protein FtsL